MLAAVKIELACLGLSSCQSISAPIAGSFLGEPLLVPVLFLRVPANRLS
jgi:hypothetical protein